MNREQVHEAALATEQVFPAVTKESNQYITRADISDYIAKHPADVKTDASLNFILDNFQLISHLDPENDAQGQDPRLNNGTAVSKDDLRILDMLTSADGSGKSKLISDYPSRDFSAAFGGAIGAATSLFTLIPLWKADLDILKDVPGSVQVLGGIAAVTAIGAGIGYVVGHEIGANFYDKKAKQVAALYNQ